MILPKITVITPTLNTGETIATALESVATQYYKNIEHIIVDGASKDKTLPTIRKYQKMYKHIRLLTEKDSGIYQAMNKGLDLSTGDWIYFMGADDLFYNEKTLTELVEQSLFQEEQIVYGNVMINGDTVWAKDKSIYDGPFTLDKLFRRNICHQSMFYPKSVIKQVGYFNPRYHVTADWDYNIRCWARYRFTFTDHVIAIFKTGGKSSEGGDTNFQQELPGNVIKYFNLDVQDQGHHAAASPFYWVMALYRENEHLNKIQALLEETENLKQEVVKQDSNHGEKINTIQVQYEQYLASMRSEYDQSVSNLKTEQDKLISEVRAEYEMTIGRLKTETEQVVHDLKNTREQCDAIRAENEETVSRLKIEYDLQATGLREKYEQGLAAFREEQAHAVAGLKEEYSRIISGLKEEHASNLDDIRREYLQTVDVLQTEHAGDINRLKSEHEHLVEVLKTDQLKTIGIIREGFEAIIRKQEEESQAFREVFLKKEHEFEQTVLQLRDSLSEKEIHYGQEVEKTSREIALLKSEIRANEHRINEILNSYTWKTGRVLLWPLQLFLRK
jgi:glycosyltransferase involved in cell wall biosynthesis